jgi:hypothetical protein
MQMMIFRIELPCIYATEETDEQEKIEDSLGIKFNERPLPEVRPVIFYNIDAVAINRNKDTIRDMGNEDISTIWVGSNHFVCALSQDEVDKRIMEVKLKMLEGNE